MNVAKINRISIQKMQNDKIYFFFGNNPDNIESEALIDSVESGI